MRPLTRALSAVLGTSLCFSGMATLTALPAQANPAGTGLVINEVYGAGGNTGAAYNADFVELLNPTGMAIDLSGLALHYRSASGGSGGAPFALSGSVPAGKTWLVRMSAAGTVGAALPTPDAVASPAFAMAAAGGQVALQQGTTVIATSGNTAGVTGLVDFVGASGATSFEGAAGPAATAAASINRTSGRDTDANNADFTTAAPTPTASGAGEPPAPAPLSATDPGDRTATVGDPIAAITLSANGGTAPYSFSASALPAGLALSGDRISGTPTEVGTTTVTVTATDASGATASTEFVLTITAQVGPLPIADVQGDTNTSPVANTVVTTEGVVTSLYATGGFNGFGIQTPGEDTTPGRSDGLFVFTGANTASLTAGLEIGDSVRVRGTAKEFNGLTELDVVAGTVTEIASLGTPVANPSLPGTTCILPGTDCPNPAQLDQVREEFESEIFQPSGDYTVTDVYDGSATNPPNASSSSFFGEIGLAANSEQPLVAPTEVIDAQDTAAIAARTAWNNAHRVVLDDGSSTTYWNTSNTAAGKDSPLPWLTADHHVRVGARATFTQPVVLDYRFGWKVQPVTPVVGTGAGQVDFVQNRPAAPAPVGGDVKLATFNVLNFFTTLGVEYGGCSAYVDRAGAPVAVHTCPGTGPRGAWDAVNFERQKAKIVSAINALTADVVSIEEVENSLVVDGHERDEAMAALVAALNADAGAGTWDYVRSPAEASETANVAEQDVIRTGFIFKPEAVTTVGEADMLFGTTAFANAREPFAQVFKPVGGRDDAAFAVIVNHFKSKGSGTNDGTGQGNANPDRVAQAQALATYAGEFAASRNVEAVFLTGDFNAYSAEDPIQALEAAGFDALETPGKYSYSFDGASGSLDHVLVNAAAAGRVAGQDIWEINANETVFNQYSRHNYVGTDLYAANPFGASDHNPEVVGISTPAPPAPVDVQILGTNDFHGRLLADGANAAGAAVLSGAVKQLRAQNPHTVFAAAGDLIGASTFESFIQNDEPTIAALNEAGLEVSAAGNHEFDQGYEDFVGRVQDHASWEYIAANVTEPAGRDDLAETWTKDVGGVTVGFVGAVTEELPSLVSPGGIEGVTVTDIVEATNAAAARLKADGADLVVLLVHEGSPVTSCTSPNFTDPATVWGNITQNTSDDVDAIVSGHTHLAYNCSFPVQAWADGGRTVTERPVVSAGQYGTNLNKLVFTVDPTTGAVQAKTQAVLSLTTGAWPADPAVATIVNDAKAQADVLGARVLGQIAGPFSRAKLADGVTENRGGESTLGNLVAEVQRWATEKPESGAAQIAFMNPGGLRADMAGTPTPATDDGDVRDLTYKQAAVVQPFANTLVNLDLTGAQLKSVLEQQWQRDAAGNVPSRPFLRLGVSDGFTYTYDESPVTVNGVATFAGTVTGMWLDGEPIDPAATYSVTVNSFLASGGDNFRAFAGGTGKADTGKIDLQEMVDYLAAHTATAPLAVDSSQRGVEVDGVASSYDAGAPVDLSVSSWSLSAPVDRRDSEVVVKLGGTLLGTAPLDNTIGSTPYDATGKATIHVTLPASTPAGAAVLRLEGATTGTVVRVPLTVTAPRVENLTLPVISGAPKVGGRLTATPGTWSPSGAVSWQWLADGVAIPGATTSSLKVAQAQVGKRISVRVTVAVPDHRDGVATSEETAPVTKGNK